MFLARFGGDANKGGPPRVLQMQSWSLAYDVFWPALHQGRSREAFRESLRRTRDQWNEYLRYYKAHDVTPPPFDHLWENVFQELETTDEDWFFESYVSPLLLNSTKDMFSAGITFGGFRFAINEKDHRWVDWSPAVDNDPWDDPETPTGTTGGALISNEQLIPELIPTNRDDSARWHRFAQSFPGYQIFAPPADIRDSNFDVDFWEIQERFFKSGWLTDSLNILRGSLFFEQRASKWQERELAFPWTAILVEAIRLVVSGNPPTGEALAKLGLPVPGFTDYISVVCLSCDAKVDNPEWKHCPNCGSAKPSSKGYRWPDWARVR